MSDWDFVWDSIKKLAEEMPGELIECTVLGRPPAKGDSRHGLQWQVPFEIAYEAERRGLEVVKADNDRYYFRLR